MKTRAERLPAAWVRLTAVLAVLVVALLAALSACPPFHEWVHGERPGQNLPFGASHPLDHDPDAGCIVNLFTAGVLTGGWAFALLRLPERAFARLRLLSDLPVPPASRHLWPPLCGPPVA